MKISEKSALQFHLSKSINSAKTSLNIMSELHSFTLGVAELKNIEKNRGGKNVSHFLSYTQSLTQFYFQLVAFFCVSKPN